MQAARDALRTRILADEESAERIRLQAAEQRQRERTASGDPRGAEEARIAIRQHQENLAALARERTAARSASPGPDARQDARREPARSAKAPEPAQPTAAPAAEDRWWDVYARRPAQDAAPAGTTPVPLAWPTRIAASHGDPAPGASSATAPTR